MKVLVIGGGGREHAIAWKLAQSVKISKVLVSPGNPGTAGTAGCENHAASTVAEWLALAKREQVGLTVVGPEAPLAAGVVDAFTAAGLAIFGPTQAAAQLESSKAFAKAFMQRHKIPTAAYAVFTEADAACAYIAQQGAPIVVKADGLAAGKGVVVAQTVAEAQAAVGDMLKIAGGRVVIEECLIGEEASFIVMVDGVHSLPLATAQDHKRLLAGDLGPNTGGMGAYSPAPVVSPAVHNKIMREIITPTIQGMAADGIPFRGFLYAGVMIDAQGNPKTLEFNCRLGDPEAQPIMMRLKTDFLELLLAGVKDGYKAFEAQWDRRVALAVVGASAGYPASPVTGTAIHHLPPDTDAQVCFHAGTARVDGQLRSSGGRVLALTVLADTVKIAQKMANEAMQQIGFDGMQWRRDIGARAIK
jgi:phosphoribosylamine---glycine ligase